MKCFLLLFVLLFRIMKLRKLIRPMSPIREVKPIEYLPAPMETSPSSFLARERDISNLLSWFLSSDSTENCSCFRLVPFSDSRKSYSIHSITLTVGFAPLPSTCEGAQRRRLPLFIEASDWLMELNLSPSLIYSLCLWNTLYRRPLRRSELLLIWRAGFLILWLKPAHEIIQMKSDQISGVYQVNSMNKGLIFL